MCLIPLYEKKLGFTGVYIFYYFALKHRLRVLVRTALRGPTISVWSKNKKNDKKFHIKIIILQPFKNLFITHGNVCVMFWFFQYKKDT